MRSFAVFIVFFTWPYFLGRMLAFCIIALGYEGLPYLARQSVPCEVAMFAEQCWLTVVGLALFGAVIHDLCRRRSAI